MGLEETFATLPSEVTPEKYLAVELKNGQRGYISFQCSYEQIVEFINSAIKQEPFRFNVACEEDLPALVTTKQFQPKIRRR